MMIPNCKNRPGKPRAFLFRRIFSSFKAEFKETLILAAHTYIIVGCSDLKCRVFYFRNFRMNFSPLLNLDPGINTSYRPELWCFLPLSQSESFIYVPWNPTNHIIISCFAIPRCAFSSDEIFDIFEISYFTTDEIRDLIVISKKSCLDFKQTQFHIFNSGSNPQNFSIIIRTIVISFEHQIRLDSDTQAENYNFTKTIKIEKIKNGTIF